MDFAYPAQADNPDSQLHIVCFNSEDIITPVASDKPYYYGHMLLVPPFRAVHPAPPQPIRYSPARGVPPAPHQSPHSLSPIHRTRPALLTRNNPILLCAIVPQSGTRSL